MNIEISEYDLTEILLILKSNYSAHIDLKETFSNDLESFMYFGNRAELEKQIYNRYLKYVDKEKFKDAPFLMEIFKEI